MLNAAADMIPICLIASLRSLLAALSGRIPVLHPAAIRRQAEDSRP
jgi:hypothetical protein